MDPHSRRDFLSNISCGTAACALALWLRDAAPAEAAAAPPGADGQEHTYPIPAADGVSIDRSSQVILVRQHQEVYAFNLSCPHQNAAVKWVADGNRFQCTKHDSRYSADGTHTAGRATRNMDRFPIRRAAESVIVDASRIIRSDQDPAAWASAVIKLA